jgi:hypothetical protein
MSVRCPSSSNIGKHSRACSGAKMYSNSSRRTGEPWQRSTFDVLQLLLVGERAEPAHVLGREQGGVGVERLARGLVVVRVVHATGDGGVVVAEDRLLRRQRTRSAHSFGEPPYPDGVAEAVVDVDPLRLVCLQDGGKRLVVGVGIAEDAETHIWAR